MAKKNDKMTFGGKFLKLTRNYVDVCGDEYLETTIDNIYITKVYYNNPATIVFWSDGTKTVTKCHGSDVYSPETGLTICCLKKLIGSTEFHKLLSDWCPTKVPPFENFKNLVRSLTDLRHEFKRNNK